MRRAITLGLLLSLSACRSPSGDGAADAGGGKDGPREDMVAIPAARFLMGAQATDPAAPGYDEFAAEDEGPPHWVELGPYAIDRHEVDVNAYVDCVQRGTCNADSVATGGGYLNYGIEARGQYPVNGVSWAGAQRFCQSRGARLPTEAEWEYAARGPRGDAFAGGVMEACLWDARRRRTVPMQAGLFDGVARLWGLMVDMQAGCKSASTVSRADLRGESDLGLRGMAGNVWEWVGDWYAADFYAQSPPRDPRGPAEGQARVQRGGGWSSELLELRATKRGRMLPETKLNDVGFRCARSLPPDSSAAPE